MTRAQTPDAATRRGDLVRLAAVVALWALSFWGLSAHGVELLPRSFARELTLEAYLLLVQLAVVGTGLVASFLLLRAPRASLGFLAARPRALGYAVLLTPAIFVAATGIAFQIARPTLLAELARGGMSAVQKNAGEFGRELTRTPAWLAFAWGAAVSPIAEELFFRGVFFTLVCELTASAGARGHDTELSPSLLSEGAVMRCARAVFAWLGRGGAATVVVALVFGWLHHDMPGGLGIVRFVSALGLGLACGLARQFTGSIVPPALIHVGFNTLSLATARRLVVSELFPMKSGVPTLVAAAGAVAAWAVTLHYLLALRARAARP